MRQTYYGSDWLLMKTKLKKKNRINEKKQKTVGLHTLSDRSVSASTFDICN